MTDRQTDYTVPIFCVGVVAFVALIVTIIDMGESANQRHELDKRIAVLEATND